MKKSLLVILAAPSGTGKSTICKELIKKNKKWEFSVSVTTRIPRDGEVDGKEASKAFYNLPDLLDSLYFL